MNTGKSIRMCLAKEEMTQKELAEQLNVTPTYASKLCRQKSCGGSMLEKLADVFNLSVSEFIQLGE